MANDMSLSKKNLMDFLGKKLSIERNLLNSFCTHSNHGGTASLTEECSVRIAEYSNLIDSLGDKKVESPQLVVEIDGISVWVIPEK